MGFYVDAHTHTLSDALTHEIIIGRKIDTHRYRWRYRLIKGDKGIERKKGEKYAFLRHGIIGLQQL